MHLSIKVLRGWFVSGLLCLLAAGGVRAAEQVVYVSPAGNDAWSGALAEANAQKTNGPVTSPQRARELVREMKAQQGDKGGPVQVYLVYVLAILLALLLFAR